MGELAFWTGVLAASLYVLVRASDALIGAAERVGRALGLPVFLIGVTVIAFGTSLPELVSSVVAIVRGVDELPAAAAVGSNITNILLILPAAAIVGGGLRVSHELVRVDLPFLFGSALLLLLFGFDGRLGWSEGLLSLAALAVYIVYATGYEHPRAELPVPETPQSQAVTARTWLTLAIGLLGLQLGAYFSVEAVVRISTAAGIGVEILSATVVALGTSLPELVVSIRAAQNGKPEIAVGNVIGSNIFNALGVVGIPALIGPLAIPATIFAFALPCMIAATVLCFFVLQEREMTRWDGWLLLILYLGFTAQIYRAF